MTMASKRRLLVWGLVAIGVLGLVLAAIPFVRSMGLNPRVAAAAPAFDVRGMKPGELHKLDFGLWVYRRTAEDLAALGTYEEYLADPRSEMSQQPAALANVWRSDLREYFVFHPGAPKRHCAVELVAANSRSYEGFEETTVVSKLNHFFEPCEGRTFDVSGRVFARKSWPEELNLTVPQLDWVTDTKFVLERS